MTERIDFIKAVLRFKRTIAGFASTQEHGTGLDEEVTADAAAFLEYLKGIENRFVAAEARVAELEAAQGWQPVTITEPSPDFTVELIVVGYRGDDGYWHYPDGPEGLVIRGWRPVPPSVALREPTP